MHGENRGEQGRQCENSARNLENKGEHGRICDRMKETREGVKQGGGHNVIYDDKTKENTALQRGAGGYMGIKGEGGARTGNTLGERVEKRGERGITRWNKVEHGITVS